MSLLKLMLKLMGYMVNPFKEYIDTLKCAHMEEQFISLGQLLVLIRG